MRPLDNDPPAGSVVLAPSPEPAAQLAVVQALAPAVGVETRGNGRWRYGRKLRNEQAGVVMSAGAGEHTVLPRVTRTPNVPGVSGQLPVAPPTTSTVRRPPIGDDGLGSC